MKKWNEMNLITEEDKLNYKFMDGYNLFYQEEKDKITLVGLKKNLLFYLTSSYSPNSPDEIPSVKKLKHNCNDISWYKLECPFFRTNEGRCIKIRECSITGEVSRKEVNTLRDFLSRKEIYI